MCSHLGRCAERKIEEVPHDPKRYPLSDVCQCLPLIALARWPLGHLRQRVVRDERDCTAWPGNGRCSLHADRRPGAIVRLGYSAVYAAIGSVSFQIIVVPHGVSCSKRLTLWKGQPSVAEGGVARRKRVERKRQEMSAVRDIIFRWCHQFFFFHLWMADHGRKAKFQFTPQDIYFS